MSSKNDLDIEFTKDSSRDIFDRYYRELTSSGIEQAYVRNMLEDLWYAVADEYGD
jgi:hypothetical protein